MAKVLLGIDEVGRGPWAGPLVVGAVILPSDKTEILPGMDHPWMDDLADSKKLTPKRREMLSALILKNAPAAATGWVSSSELDELGMTAALKLATRRAVEKIQKMRVPFHEILIDGTINFLAGTALEKYTTIMPKADANVPEVSAASIVAKVARDSYMAKLAKKYPGYKFEVNAGYGTAAHAAAIRELGITPLHRTSFRPIDEAIRTGVKLNFGLDDVKEPKSDPSVSDKKIREDFEAALSEIIKNPIKSRKKSSQRPADDAAGGTKSTERTQPKTTKEIGDKAETAAAKYLAAELGHEIIARNFKTKMFEIDIVSATEDKIYFTEVKYRKDELSALEAIDRKKLERMQFAAEAFMEFARRSHSTDMDGKALSDKAPQLAAATVSGADFSLDEWMPLE